MKTKIKLPPAKFREWAAALLHIETLADAVLYVQAGSVDQSQCLRQLVRETRALREKFVKQIGKST